MVSPGKESQDESSESEATTGRFKPSRGNGLLNDPSTQEAGPVGLPTGNVGGQHQISLPYELSHYPIEIQQSKSEIQRQISNRTRMEVLRDSLQQTLGSGDVTSMTPSNTSSYTLADLYHQQVSGVMSADVDSQDALEEFECDLGSSCFQGGITSSFMRNDADAADSGSTERAQVSNIAGTGEVQLLRVRETDAGSPAYLSSDEIERELASPQHIELHTFRDAVDVNYQRIAFTGEELSGVPIEDLRSAAKSLVAALNMRAEYMELVGSNFPSTTKSFLNGQYPRKLPKSRRKNTASLIQTSFNPPEPPKDHWARDQPLPANLTKYKLRRYHGTVGVMDEAGTKILPELARHYISRDKYLNDFEQMMMMIADGPLKTFCYRRLSFLQTHFQLHVLMNEMLESAEQRSVPHRDFYNIRKVDTHIHAASSMNQKHLLRFIKKKMRTDADQIVNRKPDGTLVTMQKLFDELGLSAYDLNIDVLDVHADRNTFHRFDKFNAKYNPVGQSALRDLFIKTDNYVEGRYFAQVLKEVLSDVEDSRYQHVEPRLSIYGRTKDEWAKLAHWALTFDVWSPSARFMVQIPRLYDVYKAKKMLSNFDEFLDNLFTPLFEVTNDPTLNPELHCFLQHISGIDSVDDESKHEYVQFDRSTPEPELYKDAENPPYSYYLYYMYANLAALNAFRRMRGLNTLTLRPHCGEAGHVSHLISSYLTSESIAHGLLLRKVPVLQYLYYLAQIGLAMSPLSNNSLFISYHRNPLPEYHMKGLNVSLSTDDPLQFHFTKEALMEEYSIAAQVWKLSSCDMCELARNSILQSGFEDRVKLHWLGPNFKEEGVFGNDISRTNVPDIRVSFRHEALVNELCNLFKSLSLSTST